MDKRRAKLLTDGDALLPGDSDWITDEDRNPHVGKPDVAEASRFAAIIMTRVVPPSIPSVAERRLATLGG